MKKNLITAFLMTIATTILLGLIYPLVITGLAQLLFHDKANGQIITRNGEAIGSRIIGQPFTGDKGKGRGGLIESPRVAQGAKVEALLAGERSGLNNVLAFFLAGMGGVEFHVPGGGAM